MNTEAVIFNIKNKEVTVYGYPELEGQQGVLLGDGMAFFFGKGWNNHELHIANTQTGKIRKISTSNGALLVDDNEVDYEAIAKSCKNGIHNARAKAIRYAGINRWGKFENGICAISWMLYPDGQYFADSDGYGMKDNDEEMVYAIIDTNLVIIEPFSPISDIEKHLKELRGRQI